MNSWEVMKSRAVKDCDRPKGSLGYFGAIRWAASIFCDVRHMLKDEDEATKAFNDDSEVTEALTTRLPAGIL